MVNWSNIVVFLRGIAQYFQGGDGFTISIWNGVGGRKSIETATVKIRAGWHTDSFVSVSNCLNNHIDALKEAVRRLFGRDMDLPFHAFQDYLMLIAQKVTEMKSSANEQEVRLGRIIGPVFKLEMCFGRGGRVRRIELFIPQVTRDYQTWQDSARFESFHPNIVRALKDILTKLDEHTGGRELSQDLWNPDACKHLRPIEAYRCPTCRQLLVNSPVRCKGCRRLSRCWQ
ncbi:MAG: hypothetical protein WC242_00855 [Candidatus Paceibacterota bacterium]|jgi:hypothetical protein